jgi:hypothetical protein
MKPLILQGFRMIRATKLYAGYMQAGGNRSGKPCKKHNITGGGGRATCDHRHFSFWIALYSKTFKIVQSFPYGSTARFGVESSERETKARRGLTEDTGRGEFNEALPKVFALAY